MLGRSEGGGISEIGVAREKRQCLRGRQKSWGDVVSGASSAVWAGASAGAEHGVSMGAEEVAWVAESNRGGGASISVRGSGRRSSRGNVRFGVCGNGNGSAAAVVGGVSGDGNGSVCGSGGAIRRQQEQRQQEQR